MSASDVSEKISFLVEKTQKGIHIMVKGRPETKEIVPIAKVEESLNKMAFGYTDKHLGRREKIENKDGTFRTVLGR